MRFLASILLVASLVTQIALSPATAQSLRLAQTDKPAKKKPVARSSAVGRIGSGQQNAEKREGSGKVVEGKKRSGGIVAWPGASKKDAESGKSKDEPKREWPKREIPKDRGKKDDAGQSSDYGKGKGSKGDSGQSGDSGRGKGSGSRDDAGQSDDSGKGKGKGKGDGVEGGNQGGHRPPGGSRPPSTDKPPQSDGHGDRPRPDKGRRWPDVRIVIDPVRHHDDEDRTKDDEEYDEPKKDDEEYDEPKKDESGDEKADESGEPTNATVGPPTPPRPTAFAPTAPRNLKYDGRTYRRLIDVLLERKQIGAALRVLQLLKDREYLDYTGDFGALVATDASAPGVGAETPSPQLARSFGAPTDWRTSIAAQMPSYAAEATNVAAKDKKKAAKDDEESTVRASGDQSWEAYFESRSDAILTASEELEQLRAIPESERKKKQQARIAELEAELDGATRDLDGIVDHLSGELGKKDGRVKRLRDSDDLMAELSGLGPGVVALYTILTDSKYWIVLVTPTAREAFSRPVAAADLNRKVLGFRDVLRDPTADPLPLAKELYTIVVGPVEKRLQATGAKTLMWSFDGVLRYIPIVALHDGKGYFVERYANAVFTRATLDRLREGSAGQWNGVGLGVSKQVGAYKALPAVADELHGIFRAPAAATEDGVVAGDVILDDTFTGAALEAAMTDGNRVLHIASHFQLNPGDARASQLLLGDGSLLTVGEIRKFKGGFKGVDLLTLSACDTAASGTAPDGKEVESFGTVAQDRGARSVLASLWPVHDGSTSALMQSFYRLHEAQSGVTKAEALRRAQTMLLTGSLKPAGAGRTDRILVHTADPKSAKPSFTVDPKAPFAHPYYWSSFVLIGSWK
jgi:CHAT domain-containing protein